MPADGLAANTKKDKMKIVKLNNSNNAVAPETARGAIWAGVLFWWTASLEVQKYKIVYVLQLFYLVVNYSIYIQLPADMAIISSH